MTAGYHQDAVMMPLTPVQLCDWLHKVAEGKARMAQDGTPLVELDGVRRTYRRGEEVVRALAGVSMTVREKELVVVTGPSGSGKSTLLHVMAGLDRPDEGDVKLEGTPIARMSDDDLTLYRR